MCLSCRFGNFNGVPTHVGTSEIAIGFDCTVADLVCPVGSNSERYSCLAALHINYGRGQDLPPLPLQCLALKGSRKIEGGGKFADQETLGLARLVRAPGRPAGGGAAPAGIELGVWGQRRGSHVFTRVALAPSPFFFREPANTNTVQSGPKRSAEQEKERPFI